MIINKIFQIGLDIRRIDLYTNPDTNIMNMLVDRFEGYCYKSCYVRKILRVVRRSECVIDQDSLDAFGKISVQFEASVEVLLRGDIVTGCVVQKKNPQGVTICIKDNLVAGYMPHPMYATIMEGQLISVKVINVKYSIGQPRITAQVVPFTYTQGIIYQIGEVTDEDITFVSAAIEGAKAEEAKLAMVNNKLRDTFKDMLYAFETKQKPPTGTAQINILDVAQLRGLNGYVVRDYRADLTTPVAFTTDYPNPAYLGVIVERQLPARGVLVALIHDYTNYIKFLRELTDTYADAELLQSHKNLWKIFKKSKLREA